MPMMAALRGSSRVRVRYDTHLPSLFLQDGKNLHSILTREVLFALYGHVLGNKSHLYGVCSEDCGRKNSHVPTHPEVATTIARILKVDQVE